MKKVLFFIFAFVFATNSFATDIAANVTNPVCDNDTLSKYNGTANVEINWEPNTIALRWYDGDTLLNVPTESQSCVYDGSMYIPPQPTKTGYTFMGWTVIDVPMGYTKLEYLESSGTQSIDTGYIFTSSYNEVAIKFEFLEIPPVNNDSEAACISGAENSGSGWAFIPVTRPNSNKLTFYHNPSVTNALAFTVSQNIIYTLTMTQQNDIFTVNLNDQTRSKANTYNGTYTQTTYSLFNDKYSIGYRQFAKARIYYAKIYDGGVLVRDMIPVRRNSDNVLGMYDTVSGQFFTNAGTGSFTAGRDMLPSGYTTLEYIESTGTQCINTGLGGDINGNRYKIGFMRTSVNGDAANGIIGTHNTYYPPIYNYPYDRSYIATWKNYWEWGYGSSYREDVYTVSNNVYYDIELNTTANKYIANVNGQQLKNVAYIGNRSTANILIGAVYVTFDDVYKSKGRFYYAKIYGNDGTTLLMNLIPAKRNSDNEIGMYDTISGRFITNAGTGSFIAGPVVQ